jgi:hypothetical protein
MSWTMKTVIASAFLLTLLSLIGTAAIALGVRFEVNPCYQNCAGQEPLQLRLII